MASVTASSNATDRDSTSGDQKSEHPKTLVSTAEESSEATTADGGKRKRADSATGESTSSEMPTEIPSAAIVDAEILTAKIKREILEKDYAACVEVKVETGLDSGDDNNADASPGVTKPKPKSGNGTSDELHRLYCDADPMTRAVAEHMIQAASSGNKSTTTNTATTTTNFVRVKVGAAAIASDKESSKAAPNVIAPDVLLPGHRKNSNTNNSTPINKGKEPSSLEMALKQQGITQSDQLRSTQFPFRLHNMLDDAERSGHAHIVSWCPGGESFKIHKPAKLINVLQQYFRQSKFKSFLRQLQGYNFNRITRGKDMGVVSHPLFLRGRRSVSTLMKRKRVGPKAGADQSVVNVASAIAANKAANSSMTMPSAHNHGPKRNTPILSRGAQHAAASSKRSLLIPTPATYLKSINPSSLAQPSTKVISPVPQDVLCVDASNDSQIQQFQGNRKLSSIVKKIRGHYTSANESVKTMIVNEISTRIKNGGSRFLKLTEDGMSWTECNREEMLRKVIMCFESEIRGSTVDTNHVDLTREMDGSNNSSNRSALMAKALNPLGETLRLHGLVGTATNATANSGKRIQKPRPHDVVLRGGPASEKEGNAYLKTMIQANVGQQVDSFEMKRIKCRAILERMKRRGSLFFLKLNETDSDDDMYVLSDSEAQDVIYTAFCGEEKKMQNFILDTSSAASMLRSHTLAGLDTGSHLGLSGLSGVASQFGSRAAAAGIQSEAALLSQLNTGTTGLSGLLSTTTAAAATAQASFKRPLQQIQRHLSAEELIEKRLRAETDEHIKLLLERERHRRSSESAYGGLSGHRLGSFSSTAAAAAAAGYESSIPLSAYGAGAATSAAMEQILQEREAERLLLKARSQFAAAAAGPSASSLVGLGDVELPKGNSHFVEFLKKKYVKGARDW